MLIKTKAEGDNRFVLFMLNYLHRPSFSSKQNTKLALVCIEVYLYSQIFICNTLNKEIFECDVN